MGGSDDYQEEKVKMKKDHRSSASLGDKTQKEKPAKRKLSKIGLKAKWLTVDENKLLSFAKKYPGVTGLKAFQSLKFKKPHEPMGVIKKLARLREAERKRCKEAGEEFPKWSLPSIVLPEHREKTLAAIKKEPKEISRILAAKLNQMGIPVSASFIRHLKVELFGAETPEAKEARRKKQLADLQAAELAKQTRKATAKKRAEELKKKARIKKQESDKKKRKKIREQKLEKARKAREKQRVKRLEGKAAAKKHAVEKRESDRLVRQQKAAADKAEAKRLRLEAAETKKAEAKLARESQAAENLAEKQRLKAVANQQRADNVAERPTEVKGPSPKQRAEAKPETAKQVAAPRTTTPRLKEPKPIRERKEKNKKVRVPKAEEPAPAFRPEPKAERILPPRERLFSFMTAEQYAEKERNTRQQLSILGRLPMMQQVSLRAAVEQFGTHYSDGEISEVFLIAPEYVAAARSESNVCEAEDPRIRLKLRQQRPWAKYLAMRKRRGY